MPAGLARAGQDPAIAASHPLAAEAGREALAKGGNAFDAAVAVAAALAVVEPYSSGLGGGGFFLLHRASDGFEVMVDGRETAPGRASVSLYLDSKGEPVPGATLNGPKAAAIPGTPAALVYLSRKYGKLPLAVSLDPAIGLAREGFRVDSRLAETARHHEGKLRAYYETARAFLRGGLPPRAGELWRQPELAATLEALAKVGHDGFYGGEVAAKLVESVQKAGGVWEAKDLEGYRVKERRPVKIAHRGALITTAPLPSSGGLTLAQALNILDALPGSCPVDAEGDHLVVEALRRAYEDRARFLGDADFVAIPGARLSSREYGHERARSIDRDRATPSRGPGETPKAGAQTTHFSIIDADGNRVAATLTLNTFFGSGFVAGDTGVLLNNEMDDFTLRPGVANVYGLEGSAANAIGPGKRPLSSMSPAFVEDQRGVLVLGTPGGSRIISMVLLAILEYRQGTDPEQVVARPRYHHQYLPDRLEVEPEGFAPEWTATMRGKGHEVRVAPRKWGNMQAVFQDKHTGKRVALNDPRGAVYTRY
ncbi:MAG: gamma-glutamyltransferase [Betaproteobacteria bacterium]|nr:gamma-glutamyltransferase [Betaproteobacteria bacterium]